MDWTLYWFMFPVALAIATLANATGIEGATFFSPIFILLLHLDPRTAIGTALITAVFGVGSGISAYIRCKWRPRHRLQPQASGGITRHRGMMIINKGIHRHLLATFGMLGLMLSLAACTGSGGSPTASLPAAAGVRPLSDILASDPQITNVQADSALVRLDTKVPVVCAVVYGTTHDYGQIATDTDMVGGAHTNHHPLLAGLKPDTLYYVRMQGVGPDGTLFRSQEYTFRTPSAQLPTRTGEASSKLNLASLQAGAKVVGVSSNFGGGDNDSAYGANKAIDSNAATQWSSNGDGDKGWIEIELAKKTNVTRVGFWSRTMGSSAQIHTFRIVTDQGEAVGPLKLADADQIYYFDMDSTAKRLRFEAVSTSGGNTGAVEIAVYGDPQN